MGKLLSECSELSVYVVGCTSMQGSFEHNRTLSQRRAEAVVDALQERFGFVRQRSAGMGVGPSALQAGNLSEAGRARNRRVVLVAR